MADLYLVADTLSHSSNTLVDALADMKFRTQRPTEGMAVTLKWQIGLDEEPSLSSRTILQILRIIQEAINNALKHARATTITVTAEVLAADSCLSVGVIDDGVGLPDQLTFGRGIRNMQDRARSAGGKLSLKSAGAGTCVELVLPLPQGGQNPSLNT